MPRLKNETITAGDLSWDRSEKGRYTCRSGNLDISTFTKADHYPNGAVLSGVPVGRITASDKYGPFDTAATDGREVHVGFVYGDQSTDGVEDINVPILDEGKVDVSLLPVTFDPTDDGVSPHFMWLGV